MATPVIDRGPGYAEIFFEQYNRARTNRIQIRAQEAIERYRQSQIELHERQLQAQRADMIQRREEAARERGFRREEREARNTFETDRAEERFRQEQMLWGDQVQETRALENIRHKNRLEEISERERLARERAQSTGSAETTKDVYRLGADDVYREIQNLQGIKAELTKQGGGIDPTTNYPRDNPRQAEIDAIDKRLGELQVRWGQFSNTTQRITAAGTAGPKGVTIPGEINTAVSGPTFRGVPMGDRQSAAPANPLDARMAAFGAVPDYPPAGPKGVTGPPVDPIGPTIFDIPFEPAPASPEPEPTFTRPTPGPAPADRTFAPPGTLNFSSPSVTSPSGQSLDARLLARVLNTPSSNTGAGQYRPPQINTPAPGALTPNDIARIARGGPVLQTARPGPAPSPRGPLNYGGRPPAPRAPSPAAGDTSGIDFGRLRDARRLDPNQTAQIYTSALDQFGRDGGIAIEPGGVQVGNNVFMYDPNRRRDAIHSTRRVRDRAREGDIKGARGILESMMKAGLLVPDTRYPL